MTICLDVLVAKKKLDFLSVGKTFKGHQQIQENPIMHLLHMRCSIFLGCYMDIVTAETEKEILVTSHCFFSSGLSKKLWRTFRKSLISITKMLRNLKNQNILKGLWRFRSQHWSLGPSITQLFRYINGLLVVLVTGSTGYITPALKAIHVVCSIQKTTPVRGWKLNTASHEALAGIWYNSLLQDTSCNVSNKKQQTYFLKKQSDIHIFMIFKSLLI